MPKITKVTNDAELTAALERVEELFDNSPPGSVEGEELVELVKLIEVYEDELYPEFRNQKLCKQRYPEDD